MRIALAQLQTSIGHFSNQAEKILAFLREAGRQHADLLVTSECVLSGYPSQDLWLRTDFQKAEAKALDHILSASKDSSVDLVIGSIRPLPIHHGKSWGSRVSNAALWISKGRIQKQIDKSLLANYDIFDESRYFVPAKRSELVPFKGKLVRVGVCEDFWSLPEIHHQNDLESPIPSSSPVDLLLSLNASPYSIHKHQQRTHMMNQWSQRQKAFTVYVNQVSAVDGLLFDGRSFVMNPEGQIVLECPAFEETMSVFDTESGSKPTSKSESNSIHEIIQALVFGIRSYFQGHRFDGICLGLSGGVDSAVVACLAAQAVGAKNVHTFALPGPFNHPMSLEDARILAAKLGTHFHEIPIHEVLECSRTVLGNEIQNLAQLKAHENLQSRIRGLLLMTYANAKNMIVLNTGNKSEIATGYCTLYGDTNGAFSPLGDVLKTNVFEIAHAINAKSKIIPQRILDRPPSAELSPNQTDQDTLPPYELLDRIIDLYLQKNETVSSIASKLKQTDAFIRHWVRVIEGAEFKRRQMPFPIRITESPFDLGRRVPIMKGPFE